MPKEFDPLATSTGLVENVDVTITEPRWAFDPEYNNGETLVLKTTLVFDDPDIEDREQFFPAGKGWTTNDKGKTAENEDGKENINFNGNSHIGELVRDIVAHNEKAARARVAEFPLGPNEAAWWDGLRGLVVNREHDWGGNIGKKSRYQFDDVYGWAEPKKSAKAGAAKKGAAAKGKAETNGAAEAEAEGSVLTAELIERLDAIADDAGNPSEFMEAAIRELGTIVTDNDEVRAAVADDSTADGIWQRAVARYQEAQKADA